MQKRKFGFWLDSILDIVVALRQLDRSYIKTYSNGFDLRMLWPWLENEDVSVYNIFKCCNYLALDNEIIYNQNRWYHCSISLSAIYYSAAQLHGIQI